MNKLEQQVWAAAFAAEFSVARALFERGGRDVNDIDGFSCAEIADVAVERLRAALAGPDREYLLPIKEEWKDGP